MPIAELGAQTLGCLRTPWVGRRVKRVESAMQIPRPRPESLTWQILVGLCNPYFLDECCMCVWDHTMETSNCGIGSEGEDSRVSLNREQRGQGLSKYIYIWIQG